jgi:hypothetical protein
VIRVSFISGIILLVVVLGYDISLGLNKKSQNRPFSRERSADNAYHWDIEMMGKRMQMHRKHILFALMPGSFYTEVQLRW